MSPKKIKSDTQLRVEKCVGHVSEFSDGKTAIEFRPRDTITLAQLQALATEFGTDRINFNFGNSGEPGYSEYTPSSDGRPGHVLIYK
jgi:hypothetical protein